MAPGVLLEPYMSQWGQGVAETPIVSKGLNTEAGSPNLIIKSAISSIDFELSKLIYIRSAL